MFKIHLLGCKLPTKEPVFTVLSPHSAAMRLKNRFAKTLAEQFPLAKTKFKQALNCQNGVKPSPVFPGGASRVSGAAGAAAVRQEIYKAPSWN